MNPKPLSHRGLPNRRMRKILKLVLVDEIRINRWTCGLPQIRPVEMKRNNPAPLLAARAEAFFGMFLGPPPAMCSSLALASQNAGQAPVSDPPSAPRFPVPPLVIEALRRRGRGAW